jgi:hypothetical protein
MENGCSCLRGWAEALLSLLYSTVVPWSGKGRKVPRAMLLFSHHIQFLWFIHNQSTAKPPARFLLQTLKIQIQISDDLWIQQVKKELSPGHSAVNKQPHNPFLPPAVIPDTSLPSWPTSNQSLFNLPVLPLSCFWFHPQLYLHILKVMPSSPLTETLPSPIQYTLVRIVISHSKISYQFRGKTFHDSWNTQANIPILYHG